MENKEKNPQINRAAYLIILSILAVLAVLAIATSSANRARRESTETQPPAVTTEPLRTTPSAGTKDPLHTTTPDTTVAPVTAAPAPITTAPETTKAPETQTSAPVDATPLKLLLPVSGQLLQGHDLEVPAWSDTMADYRTHCGMDIAAQMGASVCAAADGVIAQIWEDPMMGQCISVKHKGDAMTIYRNLSKVIPVGIEEGVEVRAGQLIANIGESAMIEIAEVPHLHFELMVGDEYADPLDYLADSIKTSLTADVAYEG